MRSVGDANSRRVFVIQGPQFQVLQAVVVPPTVTMMHALAGIKEAAKRLFHHPTMFQNVTMPSPGSTMDSARVR